MTAGKSVTRKNRSLKIASLLVALGLIFSLLNFVGVSTARAGGWIPPILAPVLSADGLSLANGVPLLVVTVDHNPAMQGIQVPRDPKIQAAIEAAVADPRGVNAAFSITYKAAGTSDPWGATCSTFPAAAKTAFNAAAAIWTATIQSSVPITISACWSNLGDPDVLGYSGGAYSYKNFTGAPKTNVWYESSLANALHGSDLGPSYFDDYITYNSGFDWYYGTDGVVPAGKFDLVTVAAHEMAHGLNFSGTADVSGTSGSLGMSGYPNIYDTFMENSAGTKLTTYTSPSTALGSVLKSGSLWFNGVNSKAANGGTRVKMYAPSTWDPGSSYSHLDYNTFAGTANSMMVYAVSPGASQHNPGPVTKGLLKDLGWVLAGSTPPSGFNSSFNGSSAGWSPVYGTWSIYNSMYYKTVGVAGYWSSAKHTDTFGNFTYEARMKRGGSDPYWSNTLIIRGKPTTLNSIKAWKSSYIFNYSNSGSFSVWRENATGTETALKGWTSSSAIVKNGWNTLKVTANGTSLKFYINGTLVWSGTSATFLTGQVGLAMFRTTGTTGEYLYVDWAKLTVIAPDELFFEDPFEVVLPGIELPGGDSTHSP
jgi:hypothetical protein